MDAREGALGPRHLLLLPILIGACLALALALSPAAEGQRSAGTQGEVAARGASLSPLIYPPQQIRLRMSHAHPAHRRLRCVRCHTRAGSSTRSRDLLIPEERSCAPCHEAQMDRRSESSSDIDQNAEENSDGASGRVPARCGYCHVGLDPSSSAIPQSDLPAPHLRFSHRGHVGRGMRCRSCHRGIASAGLGTRAHLPSMRQCLECHAPEGLGAESAGTHATRAPSACAVCHESEGDGRLRTHLEGGSLTPPAWMAGAQHDRDWLVRHRWIAADQGELCASCHRERECADCHDGRVRIRRVHRNDYLSVHPAEARRDSPRCASCHNQESFCHECHARLGISPTSAPEVRSERRFHPPSEIWIRGPALHGREARRSMGSCVSCHAERDCVACHGAGSLGRGLSPHPPGFASGCREALERGSRACQSCHEDLDRLRAACR